MGSPETKHYSGAVLKAHKWWDENKLPRVKAQYSPHRLIPMRLMPQFRGVIKHFMALEGGCDLS